MLKFNMGCGRNRKAGYVNVDAAPAAEPDEVVDLEQTPWPWPDDCAEVIEFVHSLEHMGADPAVFLAIIKETYRIAADGAVIRIHAPHPRHDSFIGDPTHVRTITPDVMRLFDRKENEAWIAGGKSNTPLALYLGVDFTDLKTTMVLDEPYASAFKEGRMDQASLTNAIRSFNNVVGEFHMTLTVRKPAASA